MGSHSDWAAHTTAPLSEPIGGGQKEGEKQRSNSLLLRSMTAGLGPSRPLVLISAHLVPGLADDGPREENDKVLLVFLRLCSSHSQKDKVFHGLGSHSC